MKDMAKRGIELLRGASLNTHPESSEVVRGMTQSLCIVLPLLTCCSLSAQIEVPRIRNIVLVYGARQMVPAGKAFTTSWSRMDHQGT
jgi:hypothetical protein